MQHLSQITLKVWVLYFPVTHAISQRMVNVVLLGPSEGKGY